jgi:hypothetical protein
LFNQPWSCSGSLFQKNHFFQIVAWLFAQTDGPVRGVASIIDRLARNFRIDTRFGGNEDADSQSRTPILQFITKCDRLAQTLHRVVLRVVRIEGEDVPYMLPEKAASSSENQKEKLEQVLQHIVTTLDYIFNYMEDDLVLLYLFCDMVAVAEGKKMAPDQAAKKVFFVVERAKRVHTNLSRLQMFVLVKHNGPEPSLVQDLILLQQLLLHGFVTAEEYEAREMEVIENIVRAFVTKGRFLEQKEQHSLIIKREKPVSVPSEMSDSYQTACQKLKLLLDEGFIETNEYNVRVSQIISRWQEERLKEQEERARALKEAAIKSASARKTTLVSPPAAVEAKKDKRWTQTGSDGSESQDKLLIPEGHKFVPVVSSQELPSSQGEDDAPPPVPDFVVEESSRTAILEDTQTERWERPPADTAAIVRVSKPLPTPGPVVSLGSAESHGSSPLQQPQSVSTSQSHQLEMSSEDAAMAKLAAALQQQAAAKKSAAAASTAGTSPQTQAQRLAASPVNVGPRLSGSLDKSPSGALKIEKKRSSIFQRVGSPSSPSLLGSSPEVGLRRSSSVSESASSVGIFDDLSVLQMIAKQRNDSDAYRLQVVEKKLGAGKKDVIQMKACVDKTFVCDGHSLNVKLLVVNHSKKPVNCIKFILQTGGDETTVNTVEDATRDAASDGNNPIFPLVKSTWQGDVQYMLPLNLTPGFYKLRVQLFYNTRFNMEFPIALHVLSKQDMWHHNPLQVFGVPLDEVLRREGGLIPVAVAKPLEALCNDACLSVEGIFRMSGDLTKILGVRDDMDSGKVPSFNSLLDGRGSQGVHMVAGVLKLFLRLLPHPLFTEALYDDLLAAHSHVKSEPMAAKIAVYKPLVAQIPESARRLFATLADFVNRFVIPHNESNKMHHANLAVIFGPVFVWRANLSPMEELSNASRVNGVVKELLEAGRELFPEVVELAGIPKAANAPVPILAAPVTANAASVAAATRRLDSSGTLSSPAILRMGTNRKNEQGAANPAVVVPKEVERNELESSPTKPLKPLPPIPRSAMQLSPAIQIPIKKGANDDDEEEDESGN